MTKRILYDYYILEFHPDHPRAEGEGWVPQQVLEMERFLGRSLSPDEDVKHINGMAHDNRIENLRVVTPKFANYPSSILESQESARKLSKTFISCRFQKSCWKDIRAPIARKNKVYLPYICSFQTEGDIYKCSHYWKYLTEEDTIDVQA